MSLEQQLDAPMNVTRRLFLKSLAAVPLARVSAAQARTGSRPVVGAIRWDAWYSPGSTPTSAVEKSLAPTQYRWRLPFFAKVDATIDKPVQLPAISQSLMDLEIRQAAYAGLDYWAFLGYGSTDPMSSALSYYLASEQRSLIRFCVFTELVRWGTVEHPSPIIKEHIALMKRAEYLRVSGGRPLYFLGFIDKKTVLERWGGPDGVRGKLRAFRQDAISAGVGNPYVVLAGPLAEASDWSSLGGDAIGAYALGDPFGTGPFSSLEKIVEARWRLLNSKDMPLVPTVMAGSDRRPRVEHPVPWEPSQRPYTGLQYYYEGPTPEELAAHLKNALRFVADQAPDRRAPAILIYAWNENDEGGWLIPTVPCQTDRLNSLHHLLGSKNQPTNPGCAVPP